MEETLALEEAVGVAMSLTKIEETLVIVTADHSHAVTTNGNETFDEKNECTRLTVMAKINMYR